MAAREGDEHAVKLFHHANANPNLIDLEDRTPLHIATQLGHVGVVELLIDKYKASVHHRTKVCPAVFRTRSRPAAIITSL